MVRQTYRRFLLLPAAGVVFSMMAACSGKSSIQTVDNPDTQPEYLSFFSTQMFSDNDVVKYWSDRFPEKYNKKVYINFDMAAYYDKEGLSYRELLEKRFESSSPDDMYIINAEDVMEFEEKGYWLDLSDMDFVENLSEAALSQSTYNGKVFSVPLSLTGFGFLWNVDMLKEHGLTVPENLGEFMAVCEKLKSEGILPYGANKGYALTVPAMCIGMEKLYNSPDYERLIQELNSGETAASTYMYEGFEFLALMLERGYLDPEQAIKAVPKVEDMELFLSGGCAFICAAMADLQEGIDDNFQIELTGLPVLEDGYIAVYGANSRLCINPESKYLDTVIDFVEMIGTPEALDESAVQDHTISCAKNSQAAVYPNSEKMVELLKQPGQIPNQDFNLHFNTWENIRDAGRELCLGSDVEGVCAMLDERQREELQKYAAD